MDSADQEDSINRIKFTEETVFGAPIEMQNLNKVQGAEFCGIPIERVEEMRENEEQ